MKGLNPSAKVLKGDRLYVTRRIFSLKILFKQNILMVIYINHLGLPC